MAVSAISWSGQIPRGAIPDDPQSRCRYGAEQLIAHGEQSLLEPSSRPERVEKCRTLVEGWKTRLANNEDACRLYADVQKEATSF